MIFSHQHITNLIVVPLLLNKKLILSICIFCLCLILFNYQSLSQSSVDSFLLFTILVLILTLLSFLVFDLLLLLLIVVVVSSQLFQSLSSLFVCGSLNQSSKCSFSSFSSSSSSSSCLYVNLLVFGYSFSLVSPLSLLLLLNLLN